MALVVMKFGGTSLATTDRVKAVAERLVACHRAGNRVVAVVSAMGSTTDDLVKLANSVSSNPPSREYDVLLSCGEQISMSVVAMAVDALGVPAVSMNAIQVGIVTNGEHMSAKISEVKGDHVIEALDEGKIVIVAGFQGVTTDGEITTLGRGGSDTTAVAVAAGINADVCEIYTDVEGVYTADPRQVPRAAKMDEISYEEMLELAASGAGVLQMRSVEFARNHGVVIHCRSVFSDVEGTYVKGADEIMMESAIVSGIAIDSSEAKITIRDVPDQPGIAAQVFGAIADAGINIDMIVQNTSENGMTDISFTSPLGKRALLEKTLGEVVAFLGAREFAIDEDIVKVSIVGAGMKSHPGIAAKMFRVLAENDISIQMISTSAIRVSVVLPAGTAEKAAQALHTAFGLDSDSVFEETQLSEEELAAKAAKGR